MRIPQYTHSKPVRVKQNLQQLGEIILPNQRKLPGEGIIILENQRLVSRNRDGSIIETIKPLSKQALAGFPPVPPNSPKNTDTFTLSKTNKTSRKFFDGLINRRKMG